MSKYSRLPSLEVGHHKYGQWEAVVETVKTVRISVLHATVSCSGARASANFQWLISFWPSHRSSDANDHDKQGPLPGAKAELFLVITT